MGGRGAASGMSDKGKKYGSEFKSILKAGNIKFIKQNGANNAKDPLETMTKGRIYVTINNQDKINSINFYGADGKRVESINLLHEHDKGGGEHVHMGYYHMENGTRGLTQEEKKLVAFIKKVWYAKHGK